jgi:hypothetical protein
VEPLEMVIAELERLFERTAMAISSIINHFSFGHIVADSGLLLMISFVYG